MSDKDIRAALIVARRTKPGLLDKERAKEAHRRAPGQVHPSKYLPGVPRAVHADGGPVHAPRRTPYTNHWGDSWKNYKGLVDDVPVEWLSKLKGNEFRMTDEQLDALAEDIKANGLHEPLILSVGKDSRTALLGEGNHRLEALRRAGFTHAPARVIVGREYGKGRPSMHDDLVPQPGEYFTSDAAPEKVFRSLAPAKADGGPVGDDIVRTKPEPAPYIEDGSHKHTYVHRPSNSYMSVVTRPKGPRSASVIDLFVPEEHRGKGIGKLLQRAVLRDFPSLQGQVSSKAAAKNAYAAGRRMAGNETASLDDVNRAIDENSSVNMWTAKADGGPVDFTSKEVMDTTTRLGGNASSIPELNETRKLMGFHRDLQSEISERSKELNEALRRHLDAGHLPMVMGTRFTTEHSRSRRLPPFKVAGYYVNPKDPDGEYGYRVERVHADGSVEHTTHLVRSPKLEAIHGAEKWKRLQEGVQPFTGLTVAKAAGGPVDELPDDPQSRLRRAEEQGYTREGYHWSPASDIEEFWTHNDLGAHFGESPKTAEAASDKRRQWHMGRSYDDFPENWTEYGTTYPVRLKLKNPLNIGIDPGEWDHPQSWANMAHMRELPKRLKKPVLELAQHHLKKLTDLQDDAWHNPDADEDNDGVFDYDEERNRLKNEFGADLKSLLSEFGYDGIQYYNQFEGPRDVPNYIAFEPHQIRSRHAKFDPSRAHESDIMAATGGRINKADGGAIDDDMIRSAVHKFGVTDNHDETGYILPDGTSLDFSGRHDDGSYVRHGDRFIPKGGPDYMHGRRMTDHGDVSDFVDSDSNSEATHKFMHETGAVRNAPGFGISVVRMPTFKQVAKAVSGHIKHYPGKEMSVDVSDTHTGRNVHSNEFDRPNARAIMNWLQQRISGVRRADGGNVSDDADDEDGFYVYHGSPHEFDKFDISRIGSGEGAQVYGHGLYFADKDTVAKSYKEALAKRHNLMDATHAFVQNFRQRRNVDTSPDAIRKEMGYHPAFRHHRDKDDVVDTLAHIISNTGKGGLVTPEAMAGYKRLSGILPAPRGVLYKAKIKAKKEHFLDWDKPLRDDPSVFNRVMDYHGGHEAAARLNDEYEKLSNDFFEGKHGANPWDTPEHNRWMELHNHPARRLHELHQQVQKMSNAFGYDAGAKVTGQSLYDALGEPKTASELLYSMGVPGIRYLDAGSRQFQIEPPRNKGHDWEVVNQMGQLVAKGSKDAMHKWIDDNTTRNYVLFHHDPIEIVDKSYMYGGRVGRAAGGPVDDDPLNPPAPSIDPVSPVESTEDPLVQPMTPAMRRHILHGLPAFQRGGAVDRKLNKSGLYSHAAEASLNLPQPSGTPQQMQAMLKSAGVKNAELENAKYNDVFKGDRVSSADLHRHFDRSQPQLKETVYRADYSNPVHVEKDPDTGMYNVINSKTGDFLDHFTLRQTAEEFANDERHSFSKTKFHKYALPGGKKYRELLLHLPKSGSGYYDSDHWEDVPNVVGHIRMSERGTPKDKILHVEELQSDWGADHRTKTGIMGNPEHPLNKEAELRRRVQAANLAWHNRRKELMGGVETTDPYYKDTVNRVNADPELNRLVSEFYAANDEHRKFSYDNTKEVDDARKLMDTPDGPYVTNSGHWTDLLLKRVLVEAARNGHRKVVFTPGEAQIDRYDIKDEAKKRGMHKFYNDFVPNRMNDLLSKFGIAGRVNRHVHPLQGLVYDDNGNGEPAEYRGHSLELTPEDHERILKGLPAFERGGTVARADGGAVNHAPTEAQKEAGNYKKRHVTVQGLGISIENPKGSKRCGTDAHGKPWEVTMPADYGYIKRTEGADGDHVDVYLGPDRLSPHAFIVNQKDLRTGKFDEHKVMLGFGSKSAAINCYRNGFSDGKGRDRMSSIESMNVDQFKHWLRNMDTTRPAKDRSIVDAAMAKLARMKSH